VKKKLGYVRKDLKNPFFRKKRAKFSLYFFSAAALILAAAIFVVMAQRLLLIKEIKIIGTDKKEEVRSEVLKQLSKKNYIFFSQENILFLDSNGLSSQLIDKFNFESIKVKKHPFNSLELDVDEKTAAAVLMDSHNIFYLNKEGMVTAKAILDSASEKSVQRNEIVTKDIPIIMVPEQNYEPGRIAINKDLVNFVANIHDSLKNTTTDIEHYELIDDKFNDIAAVSSAGYKVFFSIQSDATNQVKNLIALLEEKIKDKKIEYIDLRYGNKIFYK